MPANQKFRTTDAEEVPDLTDSSSEGEEDDPFFPLPKKKWAATEHWEQREFLEVNWWDSTYRSDKDILVFIRKDRNELKSNASIQHLPCAHKDSKIMYDDFQFRPS